MRLVDWCPKCKERTGLPERGICPWCDTPLVFKAKRGGWKRPDLRCSKLTDTQLRALYIAYNEHGMSVNALAKRVHAKVGYKSHHSCAVAISEGWKRLGLPARDRIEAVRLACTTHGRGARDRDEKAYREFLRLQRGWRSQQGPGQERCKGVKVNPPGRGTPCPNPSMTDSDYCYAHNPRRELARQVHLGKVRRSLPRPEMLPLPPFAAWLCTLHAELGAWARVGEATAMHKSQARAFSRGECTNHRPKATVSRAVVERAAAATGTSVDAIYGTALERAA